jgi:RHS repeat-associated protein
MMKTYRHTYRAAFLALLFMVVSTVSMAQQINSGLESGTPTYSSLIGSDFDQVLLGSGNIHISIPIASVKQRGGHTFTWQFVYNAHTFQNYWTPMPTPNNPDNGIYRTRIFTDPASGWHTTSPFSYTPLFTSISENCSLPPNSLYTYHDGYSLVDPNGTKHQFALRSEGLVCHGSTLSGPALDGSGIVWNLQTGVITLKDGSQLTQDPNGNTYSSSADTLNRAIVVSADGPLFTFTTPLGKTTSGAQYTNLTVKDSNGVAQVYRIDYAAFDVHSNACGDLAPDPCSELTTSKIVATKLTLPNLKAYQFSYQNNSYLELLRVDFPTGASITYTTTPPNFLAQPFSGRHPTYFGHTGISTRKVTQNGVNATWTFSGTKITDPNLNDEVHTMNSFLVGTTVSPPVETMIQYYQGSSTGGTLVRTINKDWTGELSRGTNVPAVVNLRPIRVTTTLNDGQVSKVETDYETFTYTYLGSTGTAFRSNVTERREYSYGSSAAGPLMRKTDYTYLHSSNTTYTNLNIVNRPTSVITYDSGGVAKAQVQYEYDNYTQAIQASGAVQHSSSFGASYLTRGNVTATNRWRNTDGAWLTTRNQYDDAGNIISTTDPLNHTTQFDYTDSWIAISGTTGGSACAPAGQGKAYLKRTTNALSQVTTNSYYSCTGALGSIIDPNSQTTWAVYDLFGRNLQVHLPDGGLATNQYDDTNLITTTSRLVTSSPSASVFSKKQYDQLGRTLQDQLCEDGAAACASSIKTDSTYDLLGRVSTVSNPYRTASDPGPTNGVTTTQYDALNRPTKVIPPDGSTSSNNITTVYAGNCRTVTDQAGKISKGCSDALGRLIQVFEPNSANSLVYETDYQYDVLDNPTRVDQKGNDANSANWRTRTFTYDSLSRLLTASNPESGTTTYKYDSDTACPSPNSFPSLLASKVDARGIRICMQYDALNRVTWKKYSSGTMYAGFGYDGNDESGNPISGITNAVGRLTHSSNEVNAASTYSYDSMGRVVLKRGCVPLNCVDTAFPVVIAYDLIGGVRSYTNGAGVTLAQSFDNAGRLTQINSSLNDSQHPVTLYTVDPSIGYFPGGAIRKSTLANGLTETAMYNNRLQPCRMELNSTAASFTLCTDAVPTGNVLDFTYGYNFGSSNNGNVATWSSVGNQTFTRSYFYDSVNRISTLSDTAAAQTCKGLSWNIDPWGNRTDQSVTSGSCGTFHATVGANNRFGSPYQYDAAGNMTYDGTHSYTYDDENRLTKVDGGNTATYVYDAEGRRVEKSVAGLRTDFVYDPSGNVVAETNGSGWQVSYVYANGPLIAQYRDGTTYSIFRDHLGSTRLLTKLDKSVYDSLDLLPYGEQLAGDTGTTHKFTGKERDSESGLDNFGARYDSSAMGRFMSPDMGTFHIDNPQSLNRYTYALNNPLFYIDPDGEDSISAVYHLGSASRTTWVQDRQHLDMSAFLVPSRSVDFVNYGKGVGIGQAPYLQTDPDNSVGGCNLGCIYGYSAFSVKTNIDLTFSYSDKGEITSANILTSVDTGATWIGPQGRVERTMMPGGLGFPDTVGVGISSGVLMNLSSQQLQALLTAATTGPQSRSPIYRTIAQAALEEQQRREEEKRKKEDKERKKRCQQDGKKDCT